MPFIQDKLVKNGQDQLAIGIQFLEVVAKRLFVLTAAHPLFEKITRDVNIATQGIRGMAPQKKAIEQRGLPPWC